jgi:hypothetical protein
LKQTRLLGQYFPEPLPWTGKKNSSRWCSIYWSHGKKKESLYLWPDCKKPLCVSPGLSLPHSQLCQICDSWQPYTSRNATQPLLAANMYIKVRDWKTFSANKINTEY